MNIFVKMAMLKAVLLVLLIERTSTEQCTQSSYGTEFILGFVNMEYYQSRTTVAPVLQLRVMSTRYTRLDISIPYRSLTNKDVTMETQHQYVRGYRELSFNASFINDQGNTSIGGAIKVTADSPISMVALYNIGPYVVSPQILPTSVLTTNYIIPSFPPNSLSYSDAEIMVIALNDSTQVTLKGYSLSGTKYASLNALQTYIYQSQRDDLSSVMVSSNHPVAVFSTYNMGDTSYNYHNYGTQHSPMSIQVPPVDVNAVHFIVPAVRISNSIKTYIIRVYANDTGAHLQVHTSSGHVNNVHVFKGIYYEMTTNSDYSVEIISDSPILVVQIVLYGSTAVTMVPIPAVTQYMSSYLAIEGELMSGRDESWINDYVIIIPEEEASGLLVDNKPLLHNIQQVSHRSPLGNHTVITVKMGRHATVSHVENVEFGLFVYGIDISSHNHVYAHAAGMEITLPDCPGGQSPTGTLIG